jgi:hypothetical protein
MRAAAVTLALVLAGCASAGGGPSEVHGPPAVRAVATRGAPVLDGSADDAAWAECPESTVSLEGAAGPASCRVRAAVHGGALHLLVRWEDATEDRDHKPWTRAGDGWKEGPEREDVLSIAFPLAGEFTADMLSPLDATWDVWHWKSFRTDPAGFAQDKTHLMALAKPAGTSAPHPLPDGRTIHIVRPEDAGTGTTATLPKPATDAKGDRHPKYAARRPSGSAADVRARGAWRAGWWTVELSRDLSTGQPDDRDLAGLAEIPFAIAVLDRAEDDDHAASPVVRLLLPPGGGR